MYFHYDDTGLLAEYDASGQLISEYQYQPGNHWMTHPYYAKVRRSNYEASLRLEGFAVDPSAATKPVASRAAVIQAYRKQVKS